MTETPSTRASLGQRLLAVAQLMRLANVFTAIADVWMGLIVATGGLQPALSAIYLTVCTCCLYTAGMVLNDWFDAEVDAVERPERPIPSDRISLAFAARLGWGLLLAGIVAGVLESARQESVVPGVLACLIAATIVAYNAWLKQSLLGPLAMALCRVGNVLLGMSPAILIFGTLDIAFLDIPRAPALGIGCYIFGVTWFARQEHQQSSRWPLGFGALFVVLGFATLAGGAWVGVDPRPPRLLPLGWLSLWLAVAVPVLIRFVAAIYRPSPHHVQRAVGCAILSLIVIDATICVGYVGVFWALVVLSLLAPAMLLSRWLRVT